MKKTRLYLCSLLIIFLCGCSQKNAVINFSLKGTEEPVELLIGKLFYSNQFYAYDTLQLTSNSSIVWEIPTQKVSPFHFIASNYTHLFVEPGKTYNITLDYSDPSNKRVLIDDPVQQVYVEIKTNNSIHQYEWEQDFSNAPLDMDALAMLTNFEGLAKSDKALFEEMEMNQEMRETIYKDIDIYRMAQYSRIIYTQSYKEQPSVDKFEKGWDLVYNKYPISDKYTTTSFFSSYTDSFQEYLLYKKGVRYSENFSFDDYLKVRYTTTKEVVKDKRMQEILLANFLHGMSLNNSSREPNIAELIEVFNKEYQNNPYKYILDQHVQEVAAYQHIIKADFSPEVKFVDNYNSLLTLQEVFSKFKGKPLFIDFWFSSCNPCQKEFGHSQQLKEFLKANDIEMLYISIDDKEKDVTWKNTIKYFNLSGYHIRADHQLHVDMHKNYGIYMYPHYMIVNENGEVVINRASPPSSGDELIEQIKSSLRLKEII